MFIPTFVVIFALVITKRVTLPETKVKQKDETTKTFQKNGGNDMANIEIMTDCEKQRAERNKKVIADFKKLNPEIMAKGFKPYRTLSIIAKRYNMTPAGVRFVLTKAGEFEKLTDLTLRQK